jgi:hypothetical protein
MNEMIVQFFGWLPESTPSSTNDVITWGLLIFIAILVLVKNK